MSELAILGTYSVFIASYVVFALGKFPGMKIESPRRGHHWRRADVHDRRGTRPEFPPPHPLRHDRVAFLDDACRGLPPFGGLLRLGYRASILDGTLVWNSHERADICRRFGGSCARNSRIL